MSTEIQKGRFVRNRISGRFGKVLSLTSYPGATIPAVKIRTIPHGHISLWDVNSVELIKDVKA